MNLLKLPRLFWVLRDYEPQRFSLFLFVRWIRQFRRQDWGLLVRFLLFVNYFSKRKTIDCLLTLNRALLKRLREAGFKSTQIIYMSVHDAGSSSQDILSLLRNHHTLGLRGVRLLDSKDTAEFIKLASQLDQIAIVYVDDFAGTGDQFAEARNFLAENLPSNVSEFFLLPAICEEAVQTISQLGVDLVYSFLHTKQQRPLHPESNYLSREEKERLVAYCNKIDDRYGLGYGNAATMVVFYRNSPNSTPLILRGGKKQKNWIGIIPRFDDLPMRG